VHALRQLGWVDGFPGYVFDGEGAIGLRAGEYAVGKLNVGGVESEQMRGDRLSLGRDPLRRDVDGRTSERGGARAAGALADEGLRGVTLDVMHLRRIEAEPVAHDLLEDGFVALALRHAARQERRRAGLVETDLGRFESIRRRALDGIGDADAAQLALLA